MEDITELPEFIRKGIDLDRRPLFKALLRDIRELYELAREDFGYQPLESDYISKCHLCLDVRKFLVEKGASFKELLLL